MFIWKDRLVKVTEDRSMWRMSAVGGHDDWDFMPVGFSESQAVAGSFPPFTIVDMEPLDDNRIVFRLSDGSMRILVGDPMFADSYIDNKL